MKLKLHPIKSFTAFLGLLALFAVIRNFSEFVLLHLVATLGFALVLYWLYSFVSSKHKNIWNTVTTALIIFLVLHFGSELIDVAYPLVATFIAITIKFFVEYKGSPVFNPAVAGLLLTAAIAAVVPGLENPFVSWWGASFGPSFSLFGLNWGLSFFIVLAWILVGLGKWKKLPILVTFLIAHWVLVTLKGEGMNVLAYTLTDSTIYFMVAAMLVEPKTSPLRSRDQMYYGLVAALGYHVFLQYQVPYAALFAIAVANLANVLLKPRRKKKRAVVRATSAEE